jgi:hypothetical protein
MGHPDGSPDVFEAEPGTQSGEAQVVPGRGDQSSPLPITSVNGPLLASHSGQLDPSRPPAAYLGLAGRLCAW